MKSNDEYVVTKGKTNLQVVIEVLSNPNSTPLEKGIARRMLPLVAASAKTEEPPLSPVDKDIPEA